MSVDVETGLLAGATFHASPHCNERPGNCDIDCVVIHNISLPPGEFGGTSIDDLFLGRLDPQGNPELQKVAGLEVSAHLLIRRDGEVIQYVPFQQRAWHAGVSSFQGREACNDFSIGIELEGTDCQAFTEAQYQQLIGILRDLIRAYPAITPERITGHSDIAPGRKTDPGPYFEWAYLRDSL